MNTLTPDDLGSEFRDTVFTQDYTKKPLIDGVRFIDLKYMVDDGGGFAELVRFAEDGSLEGLPEFTPRQTSYSQVLGGAIKAFHLHFNQEDVWFVPPTDRLLVGLVDARQDSPTYNTVMRFMLGGTKAQLLYIPRGVAHGCANTGNRPAHILYFVNQQFNLADPDERRLPWDQLGKEFWQVTQG